MQESRAGSSPHRLTLSRFATAPPLRHPHIGRGDTGGADCRAALRISHTVRTNGPRWPAPFRSESRRHLRAERRFICPRWFLSLTHLCAQMSSATAEYVAAQERSRPGSAVDTACLTLTTETGPSVWRRRDCRQLVRRPARSRRGWHSPRQASRRGQSTTRRVCGTATCRSEAEGCRRAPAPPWRDSLERAAHDVRAQFSIRFNCVPSMSIRFPIRNPDGCVATG